MFTRALNQIERFYVVKGAVGHSRPGIRTLLYWNEQRRPELRFCVFIIAPRHTITTTHDGLSLSPGWGRFCAWNDARGRRLFVPYLSGSAQGHAKRPQSRRRAGAVAFCLELIWASR